MAWTRYFQRLVPGEEWNGFGKGILLYLKEDITIDRAPRTSSSMPGIANGLDHEKNGWVWGRYAYVCILFYLFAGRNYGLPST